MATKRTSKAARPDGLKPELQTAKPLELADLAHFFGADRWAALEKQAATVRAWDGNKFRNEAGAMLEAAVKRSPAAREAALHDAGRRLLIALGSAP
jgi:hypothetical protein